MKNSYAIVIWQRKKLHLYYHHSHGGLYFWALSETGVKIQIGQHIVYSFLSEALLDAKNLGLKIILHEELFATQERVNHYRQLLGEKICH